MKHCSFFIVLAFLTEASCYHMSNYYQQPVGPPRRQNAQTQKKTTTTTAPTTTTASVEYEPPEIEGPVTSTMSTTTTTKAAKAASGTGGHGHAYSGHYDGHYNYHNYPGSAYHDTHYNYQSPPGSAYHDTQTVYRHRYPNLFQGQGKPGRNGRGWGRNNRRHRTRANGGRRNMFQNTNPGRREKWIDMVPSDVKMPSENRRPLLPRRTQNYVQRENPNFSIPSPTQSSFQEPNIGRMNNVPASPVYDRSQWRNGQVGAPPSPTLRSGTARGFSESPSPPFNQGQGRRQRQWVRSNRRPAPTRPSRQGPMANSVGNTWSMGGNRFQSTASNVDTQLPPYSANQAQQQQQNTQFNANTDYQFQRQQQNPGPSPSGTQIVSNVREKMKLPTQLNNVVPKRNAWQQGQNRLKQLQVSTSNPWDALNNLFVPTTTPTHLMNRKGSNGFDAWGYSKSNFQNKNNAIGRNLQTTTPSTFSGFGNLFSNMFSNPQSFLMSSLLFNNK